MKTDLYTRIANANLLVQQGAPRRLAFSASGVTEEKLTRVLQDGAFDLDQGNLDTDDAKAFVNLYKSELTFYLDMISTLPDAKNLDVVKARFPWMHTAKPSEIEVEYGHQRMDQSKLELGEIRSILADLQQGPDETKEPEGEAQTNS